MMEPIDQLAKRLGIAPSYRDQDGKLQIVPESTKRALIEAFGIALGDTAQMLKALDVREQASASRLLAPVIVCRGTARAVRVTIPDGQGGTLRWTVTGEEQACYRGVVAVSDLRIDNDTRLLPLPNGISDGYYTLEVELDRSAGALQARASLILGPSRAYHPPEMEKGARPWGIAIQLYGLRSARNWGVGDFTDLAEFIDWAGASGADAVGVNPLHALFLDDPARSSPYSPSSRRFVNPLYLDVEAIADFADCREAQDAVTSPDFQRRLEALRHAELVDYPAVAELKRLVLETLHRWFRRRPESDPARRSFEAFRRAGGDALERFATFAALREWHGRRDTALRDWRRWPPEHRDPASPAVRHFAQEHQERVAFFVYLQWQVEQQLSRCVEAARRSGMSIGLYLDLAVGADAAGADVWAMPGLIARGATIGAPPDIWNRLGQNWGLPPLNADALRTHAFQPFAALLRANMRWAGALRIDHVLGLMRLFWIPEGRKPSEGAYVAYPFDDLMTVVALESHRNKCLVVGEDLGTVPEGFQPALRGAGVLSYCLLYFERDEMGRFRRPSEYPADALVAITTHDLPTLSGFWTEADLDAKEAVGAYPSDEEATAARRSRREDRAGLIDVLRREGLLDGHPNGDREIFEAALRFIARTPCRLLMAGIDDMLGVRDQANLPGTVDEHPNWRRRLPADLAAIRHDPRVKSAIRILNEERPPSRPARAE